MRKTNIPDSLQELLGALCHLPGVGERTAQRIAYHLLQHNPEGALALSDSIRNAVQKLQQCSHCNTFTEKSTCDFCLDPERLQHQLCVVETPADQWMLESSHTFKGLYFVLMGRISPLDGHGAQHIHLQKLLERVQQSEFTEVIIATSFTAEGETTAHYIAQALQPLGPKITRLARGVPIGSEIEHTDASTLAWALIDRK